MLTGVKRLFSARLQLSYLLVFASILSTTSRAEPRPCNSAIRSLMGPSLDDVSAGPKRAIEEIPQLRFGTYNTYNLMQSADGKYLKPDDKRRGVAAPILENDLDVIVLQEVENIKSIQDFSRDYLKDRYTVMSSVGNDERGIQVAFLVKKDLPFKFELETHADTKALYPVTGEETKVFSRDLPALRIWSTSQQSSSEDPLVVFYGTHFKSKRDKPGDPESRILRRVQVETASQIMKKDMNEHPSTLFMIAGDFNGDVRNDFEFASLRDTLKDAFDVAEKKPSPEDRITHTFHPKEGRAQRSQIDAFFVGEDKAAYIEEAFVHRYKNADGSVRKIPETWNERNLNPSDHFPVILKMNFRELLEQRGVLIPAPSLPRIAA